MHNQLMSPRPSAENNNCIIGIFLNFIEQLDRFIGYHAEIAIAVKQKGAVAGHPHTFQRDQQNPLFFFRNISILHFLYLLTIRMTVS